MYAARWAKSAIGFMVIGVMLGIFMSATQKLELAPLHAHINLVGWASMAIFACLYKVFPALEESKLAPYHYWIYTVGFVLMMISLFFLLGGGGASMQSFGKMSIPITANLTFLGVILALVTIWRNVKAPAKSTERQSKAS